MRKIIINADDLGMSLEVNSQIEDCIRQGVVTSSTLMANAPAFSDGVRIAKQYPQISVGVHLNIIEFKPLTDDAVFRKYGMVGDDGYFIEGAVNYVSINEELKKAILDEWDAQITKVEKEGLIPTHCDSHEHTHMIQDLQETLCQVLNKHHITRVRRTIVPSIRLMLRNKQNKTAIKLDKSNSKEPEKRNVLYRRLHLFWVKYLSTRWNRTMNSKYRMTNAFYSFRDFYNNRDILRLGNKNSTIELMCHPGNKPYQEETNNLKSTKDWSKEGYKLISYLELQ